MRRAFNCKDNAAYEIVNRILGCCDACVRQELTVERMKTLLPALALPLPSPSSDVERRLLALRYVLSSKALQTSAKTSINLHVHSKVLTEAFRRVLDSGVCTRAGYPTI